MKSGTDDDGLPACPDPASLPAAVAETHGAVLFMVGDTVWKRKKPVRTDVFDFTTAQRREEALRSELLLNRRLAPDVYLDVLRIADSHDLTVDHVLAMRRMPPQRRLATLARDGHDVRDAVRAIARRVAAFHSTAARSPVIDEAGGPAHVLAIWRANTVALRRAAIVDPDVLTEIDECAERWIAGRSTLFAQRVAAGHVVDGHGDLLADDIFCLDDGPRILDCIEFDDELRHGDVVADVAFLAMDLERIGRPDAAAWFLADYREFSDAHWPRSFAHHWIALRAHTRAKVACVRAAQGDAGSLQAARELISLARAHCRDAEVRTVLVGGAPGTGKSTLAAGLARRFGWTLLRSDAVRRELAVDPGAPALHAPEMDDLVYATLLRRATDLAAVGETVVLDATWGDARRRADAATAVHDAGAVLHELRCMCDDATAAARAQARSERGDDVSDADAAVARLLAARFAPWPTAAVVDTNSDPDGTLAAAVDAEFASLS